MPSRRRQAKKTTPAALRRDAKAIYGAALDSVRAGVVVPKFLALEKTAGGERIRCGKKRFPLRPGGRLIVVGAGKASSHMARAAERILGRRIDGGAVVTQTGYAVPCRRVEVIEANHPIPDAAGIRAARKIGEWVDSACADDVVIFLISGGGSALLPAPAEGITLRDKQATTGALLKAGAPIESLNCVRKHLSRFKGGQLAARAAPARLLTLAISDVVGDPFDVIASGPTCGDPTTFIDAAGELKRYSVWRKIPLRVRRHLEKGIAGEIPDTPAPDNPIFARVHNQITANNGAALAAAREAARALGYRPFVLTRRMQGEAREVGKFLAGVAAGIRSENTPAPPPACLLIGGETTVTVRGTGLGGRCQELALSFINNLEYKNNNICLLAAGTDGKDGPTPAAGAIVDTRSLQLVQKQGIDLGSLLRENNSYKFFVDYGELISTGPTGTNVMDLVVILAS